MVCKTFNNCIHNVPIFQVLNQEQKDYVHKFVIQKQFKAGQTIYRPGEKADAIFIVSKGKIRIYRLAENGKEQLLRIIIPGEFTGELALFKAGIYEAFAEALEDVTICMIHHQTFKQLLITYPSVSTKMLEVLANRLSGSEQQTAWISTETVRDRLLHYLFRTSTTKNKKLIVELNLPKKELASYLGTTPESLSREWTKLENEGLIKQLNKNIIILNNIETTFNSCSIY